MNDCTMHDAFIRCCHQTRKLLMCAPDMLHPFQLECGLTMTYHDLPTALFFGGAKSARTNISKLWDPHPQCHWEEMVSMLVRVARALKPIAARGLTLWRLSRCISKPIDLALQNPSQSCGPSANLRNPKLKATVTEVH